MKRYRITLYWYYPKLNEHREFTFPAYIYRNEQEANKEASQIADKMNQYLTHYKVEPVC